MRNPRILSQGFTLLEMTMALVILGVIGLVTVYLFQNTTELAAGQAAQADAENEASLLLDKLSRDFMAHGLGTVAPGCGGAAGVYSHQLDKCGNCGGHSDCRFLRIWRGDEFLKQNFGDPKLDVQGLNYWSACADAPPSVAGMQIPSICGKQCPKGKVPVVHFSKDNGVTPNFTPAKTFPVGLTNGTSSQQKAVGMELCLSQSSGGLTAQTVVYYVEAKNLRRFLFTTIMPVKPMVSENLKVVP